MLEPTSAHESQFFLWTKFLSSNAWHIRLFLIPRKAWASKVGCPVTCSLVIQLQGKIYCVARTIKIANSWFQFISQPLNWLQIDMADAFAKGSSNELYPMHKRVLYIFLPKGLRVTTVATKTENLDYLWNVLHIGATLNVACRMHRRALAEPCSKSWCNTAVEDGLVHLKACMYHWLRQPCIAVKHDLLLCGSKLHAELALV